MKLVSDEIIIYVSFAYCVLSASLGNKNINPNAAFFFKSLVIHRQCFTTVKKIRRRKT